MSAKWRRSRNTKRFDIFRVFSKVKARKTSEKSHVKSSNIKRKTYTRRFNVQKVSAERKLREPKPLIDVLEGNDDIVVVAELAGFTRKDLAIRVKNQRLTLSAEASERKYHKSLNLPKRVIPSTMRITYKNGVLEIRLKKVIEEKALDRVAG